MKAFIILLFVLSNLYSFGQHEKHNGSSIFFRRINSDQITRLFFGDVVEFKLKDSCLLKLNNSVVTTNKLSGSTTATLLNASLDTFYFSNSLSIAINQIEWIYSKSFSYYIVAGVLTGFMVPLGFFNYSLLSGNESNVLLVTANAVISVPLVIIAVNFSKRIIYTENWYAITVSNKNIFAPNKRSINIFKREKLPTGIQRK